ncbi:MAG: hypothetical protein AABZ08_12385 [Planctomycetota bacterium]
MTRNKVSLLLASMFAARILVTACNTSLDAGAFGTASPTFPVAANGIGFPLPAGSSLPGFPVAQNGATGPSWQTAVFGSVATQP